MACLVSVLVANCGGGGAGYSPGSTPSPTPTPIGATAADLQFCADTINQLRTRVGKAALAHSSALDDYGQKAASNDGQSGVAHQYFRSNNGAGVSLAENEVIAWGLTEFGTVQGVISAADNSYWAEGPSGGHYQNVVGPYTQVGCGVYINGQAVTVTTEFR